MYAQRKTPNEWWVAVVAGMASYVDAAATTGFGTAIIAYQRQLGLTALETGVASGALTAGIAVGALVGGRLGDRFGRRPVFTVTMILIIVGVAAVLVAPSFPVVLTGVVLLGLGCGADLPVSLSTIAEAARDEHRGRLIGFANFLWIVGAIANAILTIAVGDLGIAGAHIILAHVGVVAVLVLIARLTIPESQIWLRAREERRQGVAVAETRGSIRDLVRAPLLAPFVGLLVFYAFANLVANTSGQFGNFILVNYGHLTFAQVGLVGLPILPLVIFGYLWFMRVADKPRRFAYFRVGAVCFVLYPLILAVFGVSLLTYVIATAFSTIGMSFAFEGIMKVWTQESFPPLLRTTAQGTIISFARVLAAGLATVTAVILQSGTSLLYGLLTVTTAIGVTTAWVVFRHRDRALIAAQPHGDSAADPAHEPVAATLPTSRAS